jgi:GTP-binding protein
MVTVTFYRSVLSPDDFPSGGLPEICISGRSNVGKSSLINRIFNTHKLARVSQTPGKTRSLNYYFVNAKYYIVDLPGYGYANVPKVERNLFATLVNPYLMTRNEVAGIIQLFDARHGPVARDDEMMEWLKNRGGNILYVFTKVDKLSGTEREIVRKKYENELGSDCVVMFSARTGKGIHEVYSWIETTIADYDMSNI